MAKLRRLQPQDYTVAWLCALPKTQPAGQNLYTYGTINGHNIVLACLPPGQPGKLSGLKLVQPLSQSFPNLRIHLFVGIGGGVPRHPPPDDPERDIRLGDVAVGWAEKTGEPGVVQWDYVRYHGQDKVESLGSLDKPDWQLVAALGLMLRDREMGEKPFHAHLTALNEKTSKFAHPGQNNDNLFQPTYQHVDDDTSSAPCNQCKVSQLVKRSQRTTQEPVFHQGTIASGDSVMQNAERRDVVSRQFHNAICFEMEAAGVIDQTHCLVIRGISDYSDSHKNGFWQNYAAATAAAFAKQFLFTVQPSKLASIDPVAVSQTIQALSPPLQAINQALPLIQQQTENTAITIRAVYDEARDSRQEARDFREKALLELTKVADRADSSPGSLERTIATTLTHHSAGMNQLTHDLQLAHSQNTGEVVAKLEALDKSIKGLQIGLISKPGLMQSVCEENDRLENVSGPNNERIGSWLRLRDGRTKRRQKCTCKLEHNSSYTEIRPNRTWKFIFETERISHHRTCPLFATSANTTVAKFRLKNCRIFLAGAIEASISIIRGAGGSSINPTLQCARVVPYDSPAFRVLTEIFNSVNRTLWKSRGYRGIRRLKAVLNFLLNEYERLFRNGEASPYDVDLDGNTLLHVATQLLEDIWQYEKRETEAFLELMVHFLMRLEELHVPRDWTNDLNLTFVNHFFDEYPEEFESGKLLAPITRLLDTGAEFANLSTERPLITYPMPFWMRIRCLPIRMTRFAISAGLADSLEDNELSIAIWRRSEQELDKALRQFPYLINQTNGLANTPLHLAVSWPYGIRALLEHGACLNATDPDGFTPLYYAIFLAFPETISLLMKAGCSLSVCGWDEGDVFSWVTFKSRRDEFDVSQDTRTDALDTFISSLAERRHDLQSRLVALPKAFKINAGVFQDDRVLDEYTQYAEGAEEDALRGFDYMPRYASALLLNCWTVYHSVALSVEIAEKLWQNGFRGIDVPNEDGWTPLMTCRYFRDSDLIVMMEIDSWLIGKGAKLHRPQHRTSSFDPDPTLGAVEMPPVIRALHYVAAHIGFVIVGFVAVEDSGQGTKRALQNQLNQLSKEARRLPATVLLDVSNDDCICACSSQGCLASTIMFKQFSGPTHRFGGTPKTIILAIEDLIGLIGPSIPCPDWLVKELIRYGTFKVLELRHTCCWWYHYKGDFTKLEPEEQVEIRDEDHEKIELLESLLQEFEEKRGTQDVLSFLEGYWTTRMDQVLQQQGCVDEEALREIGVVLHEDDEIEQRDRKWNDRDRSELESSDQAWIEMICSDSDE